MKEQLSVSGGALRLVILAACLSAGMKGGQGSAALTEIMKRAHAYVAVYEDHELSTVIARERYRQQWFDAETGLTRERTLLSDYLLFQLPPDESWLALRYVYEVDGMPVGDRAARLKGLFAGPREQVRQRVMEIDKESARFNLGELCRTVNVPTFALRFLRPANRHRFAFSKAGEEQVEGRTTWVVAYRETKDPTFVATPDGRDVPAHGRFWIEPETGAVLRSEMILGGTRRQSARATITVTFALEPSLGFRVPIEMRERYDDPRRQQQADTIDSLATYVDFRPFDSRTFVLQGPSQEQRPPAPESIAETSTAVCQ